MQDLSSKEGEKKPNKNWKPQKKEETQNQTIYLLQVSRAN